jgi:hypothetical protein
MIYYDIFYINLTTTCLKIKYSKLLYLVDTCSKLVIPSNYIEIIHYGLFNIILYTCKYDTSQQPINTCHINIHLVAVVISSCMVKNFKIFYLTHMISILNFVFTVVF